MAATMKARFFVVILAFYFLTALQVTTTAGQSTVPTTAAPSTNTAAEASPTTAATAASPTTDSSTTVLTTNAATEGSTSTDARTSSKPVKYCEAKPCGTDAATCTEIHGDRICNCPYGYYYDENNGLCSQGRQFFGRVTLGVTYSSEFLIVTSSEYKSLYENVTKFFKSCFINEPTYMATNITKITEAGAKSRSLKATAGNTEIETINIFTATSNITQEIIATAINNTIHTTSSIFTNYEKLNICDLPYCDEATTICNSTQDNTIAACHCRDGFFSRSLVFTVCPDCETSCKAENKKECIQEDKEKGLVPVCQCLINHMPGTKEDAPCVECDYGYSGKHCEDSFQLILVIVGCIAAALVLGLLGGVIALSVKSKKTNKSPDREQLIKPEDNAVFSSSQSTEVPHFPRVTVKASANTNTAASANPYEADEPFQRTVPTRDYDDDNDSWFEMAPKNTTFGNNSKY